MNQVVPKRKSDSLFNAMVDAINSYEIGETYKVSDMRKKMSGSSRSHTRTTNFSHRTDLVGKYHLDLLSTKCIVRVKRGYYKVLGIIPEFLTQNMCQANRGYTNCIKNPEFKGYEPGTYKSIDGIQLYLQIARGKTWHLGESNPFCTCKPGEVYNNLCCPVHGTATETTNVPAEKTLQEVISEGRDLEIIAGWLYNLQTGTPGYYGKEIHAVEKSTLNVYIIIDFSDDNIKCKEMNGTGIHVFAINQLKDIILTSKSEPSKEYIISVLKQGLSATDAADMIIEHFNL